nr:MAG TPA: Protein involved in gliding motility 9 Secretion System Type.5A [Crassvirales sp.]
MKKFLLLLLVSIILTSCYTNGDTLIAVKEAHPDSEIYQIKTNEFILVDSIGIWYVNANMGVKEPYTEKQLVRLWSNYGREITYDNAK